MPTCVRCDGDFTVEELTRHEDGPLLIVHCPDCGMPSGATADGSPTNGSRDVRAQGQPLWACRS